MWRSRLLCLSAFGLTLAGGVFALRSTDAANPTYPPPGESAFAAPPNFTQPQLALPNQPQGNVLRPGNKTATPTRIAPPATGQAAPLRDPFVRPAQNLVPVEPNRLPDNMAARPLRGDVQGQARLTSDETPTTATPQNSSNLLTPAGNGGANSLLMPSTTPSNLAAPQTNYSAPTAPAATSPAPTASPYSLNNTPAPSTKPGPTTDPASAMREPRPLSAFDLPAVNSPAPLAKPEGYAAPSPMTVAPATPASPYSASTPLNNEPVRMPTGMTTGNVGVKPIPVSGNAKPGDKRLDGAQAPQLTIEKVFPAEVIVGKPAAVLIRVRNAGTVTAQDVTLTDPIPEGMQFHKSQPATQPTARGELQWSLGALSPGQESTVSVELIPQAEGELGSVASVAFRSEASGRTTSVRPQLQLQASSQRTILAGQELVLSIKITNPGSGTATNVVLEEHVPAAMKHAGGSELELDIGTLKPGESRELDLALKAEHAGRVLNNLTARGDGGLRADAKCEFEVVAPGLQIAVEGPAKRYLERPATYTVSVSNPGTAPAKEVELVANLPRGVKFVKADHEGTYDAASHSVYWSLEELPAQEKGAVTITTLPIEQGEHKLKVAGKTKAGLADSKEQNITIEGVAAILFEVADLADPIELRGETAYDVRIINQGSKAATNVQLTAFMPGELKFLSAEGATRYRVDGQRIVFDALGTLPAKSETVYRVRAQGVTAGDVRLKVQLVTDDIRTPITKEESTRVYADE